MTYTGSQVKQKGGKGMPEVEVGTVSDFFAHPVVAGIDLSDNLQQGNKIHIKGNTTDFELTVDSIQINNAPVTEAKAGDAIGIKVSERVRRGDTVYKVID
jgi:translation initiation factor IF-2